MISATERDLLSFWSGFGVRAFKSGEVDTEAELPYIVYTVEDGDALESTVLTAYVYVQAGQMAERRRILDAASEAIPTQGVMVGNMLLQRNTAGWQMLGKDDESIDVHYGRISYIVRFF